METLAANREKAKSLLANAIAETLDAMYGIFEAQSIYRKNLDAFNAQKASHGLREMFGNALNLEKAVTSLNKLKNPTAQTLSKKVSELSRNLSDLSELLESLARQLSAIGIYTDFLDGKATEVILPE